MEESALLVRHLEDALLASDRVAATRVLESAAGWPAIDVVERLVVPAMDDIGKGWERGTVALSQVYMTGRICEQLVDRILPPAASGRVRQPTMAIGVLADQHALGKRIVRAMLRAAGFEVLDYGAGLRTEDVLRRVEQDGVRVLLLSVLMLPSALEVRTVTAGLAGRARPVRVVVGGAPFLLDDQLWRQVGADRMGRSAADAVPIVRELLADIRGEPA